jgi:ABC-type thiamine transport system substrate-binding protein
MSKIRVLGETRGPKHEVEKVVHDHLYAKLAEIERNISELESTDAQLTARYRMKWGDFKTRFEKHKFGEDADVDFIEWESAVELLKQLRRERDMLKDALE